MPGSRIELATLPTPLEPAPRLTEAWSSDGRGPRIWIKRDDLAGFELSGNKVRKLEFHLGAAVESGASTVITCGAAQSNHCRATALAASRLGMQTILFLRTPDGGPPPVLTGNYLLQPLAGADCRFITPDQWVDRDRIMAEAADEIDHPWVIPEGASDALGMLGFVAAATELAPQLDEAGIEHATIWHAASSAGTTVGLVRGAGDLEANIVGASVGDSAGNLERNVIDLLDEADQRFGDAPRAAWRITDHYVGGGYGVTTNDELAMQVEATRLTGLIWDPTYTGKAIVGLRHEINSGGLGPDTDVVFWHTGGGFATFAHDWEHVLESN